MKRFVWFLVLAGMVLVFLARRLFTTKSAVPPREPLAQAVFDNNLAETERLLNAGANPNTSLNITYQIAPQGNLHWTFSTSQRSGAQQKSEMSILAFAAMQGNNDILRLLLQKGAEVNSTDKYGQTPLILAAWAGEGECVG